VLLSVGSLPAVDVDSGGVGSIAGRVLDSTGKKSVAGATVLAYHLASATIYRSSPTSDNGRYEIAGLPHGYYDIAVELPDGLYVGNQVVNVPPGGHATATFSLLASSSFGPETRDFPGADQPATGIAQYGKKKKKKGVALIVTGSVLAVALLFALGGDSSPSPSTPPAP